MCGLFYSNNAEFSEITSLYSNSDKLSHRGPDNSNSLIYDNKFFRFHRLSINDLSDSGNQPFFNKEHKTILLCNGEIYNHKEIYELNKEKYQYSSKSDCESILSSYILLKDHNDIYSFINKLDGEYAFVLYDSINENLIAARDPLGIRPLFFGYDETDNIVFASEIKALHNICENILPFPPGHYYLNGVIKSFNLIWNQITEHFIPEEIYNNINNLLKSSVIKRLQSDAPIGFLLSGGLDSSLVCGIAAKYLDKPITTFSVGITENPIDTKYAKQVSEHIGSIHHEVLFTKDEVLEHLDELIYYLETWDVTTIRASVCMSLLCKYIRNYTDIKVILTGEVSDELFGYKYTDYAPTPEDFQLESIKRVSELYMYDVLRADRCISMHGLEARVPFSDNQFVKYVMEIDPQIKINTNNIGKYILRKSFEKDNLIPYNILYREKAAFSDAVGHSLVDYLKEYADKTFTDNEFLIKSKEYSAYTKNEDQIPYSKESLLYRKIFDKYYPGRYKAIKSYWMPNKEWENCNVKDPSARVLPNYGDSGK